jgi:hypothetical protein
MCSAKDHPTDPAVDMTGAVLRDKTGNIIYEHFIEPQLVYIKDRKELTRKQQQNGWQLKEVRGKLARYRFLCPPCREEALSAERAWKELKQLSKKEPDSDYSSMCDYS